MKAQNRCCPLHQDDCDHCGFYDVGGNICMYDDNLDFDVNMQKVIYKEIGYGSTSKNTNK